MKTKNLIERLSLFLLALVLTMPAWAQGGNGTEVVSIGSKAEWKAFCQRVNNNGEPFLNAKLTRDVDLGEEIVMVGSVSYPYSGTFDGNGHTLKFNWNAGKDNQIAPFWYVKDATIKNLRTQGKITSKGYNLSGMVRAALGTTTISGCISDVDITGGNSGLASSNAAGMVQAVAYQASVHITDCLVKGSITDNADEDERTMAGFVFYNGGTYTLTRCLYVGKNNATNDKYSYTFGTDGYGATFTDCYYLNTCGDAQGDKITEAQLRNGYVAYKLQKGIESQVWGQTLGTDTIPQPTTDATKRVYEVKFVYNGEVKATRYATNGQSIHGGLPTAQDLLGTGYNPHHYYAIAFEGGFNASTTVTADRQVAISFTEKDCYEITSKADWKAFCALVEDGQTAVDAKMTKDVNLETDITMAGTANKPYAGTFDGQGHTLKIDWNAGSVNDVAPFGRVNGATIKNLRTEGSIRSDGYYLGGLIDEAAGGNITVANCVSAVNITSSYTSDRCGAGGLISYIFPSARVTINDCLVKGSINATTEKGQKGMGGFVYVQNGACIMNNCLYAGTNNADNSNNNCYTFAPTNTSGATTTLNNCHYLNPCGKAQGEPVTKAQLKNGYVAHKLQGTREETVWGQTLGTDNEPQLTADATKRVYEVKFVYNGEVKATRYANSGQTVALPTAEELLGAGYNPKMTYTLNFGDFTANTPVTEDKSVDVTVTGTFNIATKEDWKAFCDIVGSGQNAVDAKMTADVDLETEIKMLGYGKSYSGTFDGQHHTLKINWNSGSQTWIAPFYSVDGATIKNLRVEGEIKSSTHFLSGLAGDVYGTTTISGCVSAVNITSSYNEGGCDAAGMIECVRDNAKVTITDCVVKGKFNATTEKGKRYMAGFVCNQNGTCTLTNCLYVGENNGTGVNTHTFGYKTTLTNCYYLNACGEAQGTQVTAEQLKSGEVTYKLQNGRDTQFWGQTLGTDNEPRLIAFDNSAKKVYQVAFTYNNEVRATRYANSGKTVSLPTIKDFMGTGYNPHHYYTIAFAGGFNGSTTVDADRTVTVTLTEKDCYDIASKEDWRAFRELVNEGQTAVDAKLTQDVNLGEEILMLGYYLPNVYSGTFDGQGHTLSFSWDAGSRNEIAPFKNVKDATIRNLRTQGKITSSGYDSQLSGLINYAYGNTTISGCVSEVDLKGRISLAGILQWPDDTAHITINDCLVKGNFHATSDLNGGTSRTISGFIAHRHKDAACTLNNCLYLGTSNALDHDKTSHTFSSDFELNEGTGFTRINNCYYLNACGEAQGTQVTEEQLASGEVAKLLQADRTDQCHWAQTLGDMPSLYREADKAEANYVYYNKENNSWVCDDFRLTDGQPLPIGLDFTATKATYERDLSIGKATLCLPYELPVQDFKAYTISEKQGNADALRFTPVTNKLEAYKPYLLMADGTVQLGGENIEVKAFNDDKLTTPVGKYKFVGTVIGMDNASATAANAYILQTDGMFHKVTTEHSEAMLPAYRAYIQRNDSGAKQLSVILDGETTGIGGVTNEATDGKNGPVYDLQGRRMADQLDDAARRRLPAGVYIVGGRKIILK